MSGFDDPGVHFSDAFYSAENEINQNNISAAIDQFRQFILQYQDMRLAFVYRDQLKRNYNLKNYFLNVDLRNLFSFKESLADNLIEHPSEYIPLFETAAQQAADEITFPRPRGEELVHEIQVTLAWQSTPVSIRELKSDRVSKIVKTSGVVVSVSSVKARATNITLQCRSCRTTIPNIKLKPGIDGYMLPRKCPSSSAGAGLPGLNPQCPLDPFYVIPDKCTCLDSQIIKLQEMPDSTPTGEIPRHLQLYCDRNLVERISPGNKIAVIGIYSIKKSVAKNKELGGGAAGGLGIRKPYLRVLGVESEHPDSIVQKNSAMMSSSLGAGSMMILTTPEEEEQFRNLAAHPDAYNIICRSIAPSIYGSADIKKAVACLLFGGSSIKLPDGLSLRGDINVLLLGDPGTAKSQILKFAEKAAPIGLYTSGKGSSAAGLTASINKDPSTGSFLIEGGAMVLADGGCVCIDEFDKMREDDRVAIHEAMEQQTISIAKVGITTTLNSRCAVLAAANSVFGRWDDLKGGENINFMPTILSRFDMIFIVKDVHSEEKDMRMASHVLNVHMQDPVSGVTDDSGELSLPFLRKYIEFCRKTCGPRLSERAAQRLKEHYVKTRESAKAQDNFVAAGTGKRKRSPIVITVRQLEAISRIGESLAKMRLRPFVTEEHIEEAIRLFHVSTWDAANCGGLAGAQEFSSLDDVEEMRRVEHQIKQRFGVGTQVTQQRVVEDLLRQRFADHVILRTLNIMVLRGELEHRLQGKVLYRAR